MQRLVSITLIGAMAFGLAACDSFGSKKEVQNGKLTHHLTMIGEDGKRYGTVELDPVGGGKIFDASGALIGQVVTPTYSPAPYTAPAGTTGY